MRENLAKAAAVLFGILAVLGALTFAGRLNPPVADESRTAEPAAATGSAAAREAAPLVPAESLDPAQIALGRQLFGEEGCARCHAAEGAGNPRLPLDGVGARRTRAELRAWIVAGPSVRQGLTRTVLRAKEGYASLPPEELEALTAYLAALR